MLKRIPNTFIIIFTLILISAALTWVIPGGVYSKDANGAMSFEYTQSSPQTYQVFTAFQEGFKDQGAIIIFVLIVGGVGGLGEDVGINLMVI